jgi:putative membrane protein
VAPFAMVGLVAFLCGLHMIFTWPLPGPYNSAFGETSVLLGVMYLGIALSLAKEWNLAPLAIYGALSGIVAVLLGARIMMLNMTKAPEMSGVGFILSGTGGILAMIAFCAPASKPPRALGSVVLFLAAVIWALTGFGAYWMHMANFKDWKPATMMSAPANPPQAASQVPAKPAPKK